MAIRTYNTISLIALKYIFVKNNDIYNAPTPHPVIVKKNLSSGLVYVL